MHIDDDNFGFVGELFQIGVDPPERAVERRHEYATLYVDHRHAASCALDQPATHARRVSGVVSGTNDVVEFIEKRDTLFLVPNVVAGGEKIDARASQLVNAFLGESESPRGVFRVRDDKRDIVFILDCGQQCRHRFPARLAYHVSDEYNLQ